MTTRSSTTVRISVAQFSADITSNHPTVTDWVSRYFGSWWHTAPPTGPDALSVQLAATVDGDLTRQLVDRVGSGECETIQYARKPLHLRRDHGSIWAHDGQIAYQVDPGASIIIAGQNPDQVASAASRMAREALRGRLATAGWVLLHASAVVDHHGRAWLAFGSKAAGKTSTALQLAHTHGWSLLANDRLFARPNPTGDVDLLPWPAAAAVGLGLLTAGGWYDTVAAARDQLHASTHPDLHTALATGSHAPPRSNGQELKAQLYPDQLTSLLGVPLATNATAGPVLLPTIDSQVPHAIAAPGGRDLTAEQDAFHAGIEDRYPPIWGIRHNESPEARTAVLHKLNTHPRWTLTLSHNIESNKTVLAGLPNSLQRATAL